MTCFNEKFMNFVINEMELLKFEGFTSKNDTIHTKCLYKWTKIGVSLEICLGNSHVNFQVHRFTTSENIARSFFWGRGYFLTHTVHGDILALTALRYVPYILQCVRLCRPRNLSRSVFGVAVLFWLELFRYRLSCSYYSVI